MFFYHIDDHFAVHLKRTLLSLRDNLATVLKAIRQIQTVINKYESSCVVGKEETVSEAVAVGYWLICCISLVQYS